MAALTRFFCCLAIPLLFLLSLEGRGGAEEIPGNRLGKELSPYLLKHASNPVHWQPWGEDAFAMAKKEDKPVFLSIGYLTCHWCNVMEEESFSDPRVAELINDVFIAVKVDREERPDIDQIYMKACQLLSPSCGWPLTLFLSPDGKPFYAATYIPKENRFGRTGLLEIIPKVKELWAGERESILKSAASINAAMLSATVQLPGSSMDMAQLDTALNAFTESFDTENGGFGRNAKFPKPLNLFFLLRAQHRTGRGQSLAMVEKTLAAMRNGGIYDQLASGFHRYTVDSAWRLPHFEKMLSDQALLAMAYLEAYQATGKEKYGATAEEVLDFVLREMLDEKGGFYSAISADSEGEEGKFYLWTADEIRRALPQQEATQAIAAFHVREDGNYVDPVSGRKTGRNILYLEEDADKTAGLEKVRAGLLAARNRRVRPETDDKVLTGWNGLMIAALARGAQVLDRPLYGEAAKRTARFLLDQGRTPEGKLLHMWRRGQLGLAATAADYAFLTWGLLELYGWDFDPGWLGLALELTEDMTAAFRDEKLGGFYLTAEDNESFLPRIKESIDTALPSSNAVSMLNLLKLSRLTGNHLLEERAGGISSLLSSSARERPPAYPMFLAGLEFALAPSQEVVIVGRRDSPDTKEMLQRLRTGFFPNAVVLFKPADENDPAINRYANFVQFMAAPDNRATAYVCTDFKCNFPTTDPAKMIESLRAIPAKTPRE